MEQVFFIYMVLPLHFHQGIFHFPAIISYLTFTPFFFDQSEYTRMVCPLEDTSL